MDLAGPPPPPPLTNPEPFRVPLHSALAPEQALLWLRGDERPFALIGGWFGGLAVLGSEPVMVAPADADPFALLDRRPALSAGPATPREATTHERATHERATGDVVVGGGWVGWLGYGLGARIERLPPPPPAPVLRRPFSLAFYDHVVIHDGERWWFEALPPPDWGRRKALDERLALWQARLQAEPTPPSRHVPSPFVLAAGGAAGHISAVADCRRRIAAGELFQANLCVRLEARFDGDPLDLLARALPIAQPRFGAVVDGVVSLSPERFLRRRGGLVQTEPIKGTRPRTGAQPERQAALDALLASTKDAAEHVMIIDLMRNDLGRVCTYGTVDAQRPRAEAHAGVWHLVSTVTGQLRRHPGDGELLRATFPPGSVTGAPKVQAMKVISTLEATRREVYTGAIGIVSPVAGLDLSVAIRTFELCGQRIWMGAGGGIVADSDPEQELQEALDKAAGPIAAIGGRLAPVRRSRHGALGRVRERAEDALAYGTRPDPARGVFETMLVCEGAPVALDQHLERLAASVHAVYGNRLPGRIAAQATDAAANIQGRRRLRIFADPDGSIVLELADAPTSRTAPTLLRPFILPGGLGAHKWRDRRLIEALTARSDGSVPLLLDADGFVLEAGHANVWILERGELLTPAADGRILPGITRAQILAGSTPAGEAEIDLGRLMAAEEIFLSSSLSTRRPAVIATPPTMAAWPRSPAPSTLTS